MPDPPLIEEWVYYISTGIKYSGYNYEGTGGIFPKPNPDKNHRGV